MACFLLHDIIVHIGKIIRLSLSRVEMRAKIYIYILRRLKGKNEQ